MMAAYSNAISLYHVSYSRGSCFNYLVVLCVPATLFLSAKYLAVQRKTSIEAKNEAETQIYSAESSIREYKDKLPQNVVDNINTEITNVRSSLESEDAEEIRAKVSASDVFALHIARRVFINPVTLTRCQD